MAEFRIGQRVEQGRRRGTVTAVHDDAVTVVWDDGEGTAEQADTLDAIGRAS